jgi:hypothetical protein
MVNSVAEEAISIAPIAGRKPPWAFGVPRAQDRKFQQSTHPQPLYGPSGHVRIHWIAM